MKLYTEESVIKLTKAAYTAGNNHNKFIFEIEFKDVNPIELPADEEIEEEFKFDNESYYIFSEGAKYMKELIIKKANEK